MKLRPAIGELVPPGFEARAEAVLKELEPPLPWYVRALTGAGGWVAAFFALGFVQFLRPGDDLMVVTGLGALGVAVTLRRKLESPFTNQLAIALALAGEAMALQGLSNRMDRFELSLTTLCIELALIAFYPDAVMRFLSTCCAFAASIQLMDSLGSHDLAAVVPVALSGALGLLWLRPRLERTAVRDVVMPVAYGLGLSALFACVAGNELLLHQWYFGSIATPAVAVVAGGFALLMLRESKARERQWLLALGGVAALALLFHNPGLLAASVLIAAGAWRRESKLIALGTAFLLWFGAAFYYHLESTLLVKAGSMLGAGVLFLALRFYVEKTAPKKAVAA